MCQCQSLGQRLDVARNDDLVGQLGSVARADIAAAHNRSAHRLEQGFEFVKDFLLAADHEAQRTVDRFRLTARNRRIQHINVFFSQHRSNLLAGNRVDRAHINEYSARLHVTGNTVFAQHNALYMRGVRQHGQNNIAALADLFVGSGLGASRYDLFDSSGIQIADQQVGVAALQDIFRHRFAHDSKTNQTNFHSCLPPLFCRCFPLLVLIIRSPRQYLKAQNDQIPT